jgi:hypothetical protein
MKESTDDVEARIEGLGQVRRSPGVSAATDALAQVLEDPEVRAALEPTRKRRLSGFNRRRRLVLCSLIALAGVGVAVPAVGTSWQARTGEFGDPSTSTEVDDTEWIDPGAENAPQVIVEAYPGYLTLPPGMPRNAAIADTSDLVVKMTGGAGPGQVAMQEGLIAQLYETFGICAWVDVWLTSDEADVARATSWIGDLDNYPGLSSSDSVRDRMIVVATAAADGDAKIMNEAYTENACSDRLEGTKK